MNKTTLRTKWCGHHGSDIWSLVRKLAVAISRVWSISRKAENRHWRSGRAFYRP